MNNSEHLVDRHIREYEPRLRHIDELLEMAESTQPATTSRIELEEIRREKGKLAEQLHALGEQSAIDWSEKGGPMVMWDVMAESLEHLLERMEHWRSRH